jgi:hypothetical protein
VRHVTTTSTSAINILRIVLSCLEGRLGRVAEAFVDRSGLSQADAGLPWRLEPAARPAGRAGR